MSKHMNEIDWVLAPEVGDILYATRGYDETHVSFFKVTRVSKTQITFGYIPKVAERVDYIEDKEVAVWYVPEVEADATDNTYRRKFEFYKNTYFATISPSQGTAYYWDGKDIETTGRDARR